MKTITTSTTFLRLTDDLLLYSVLMTPDATARYQGENLAAVQDLTEQQPFRLILDLRPLELLTSITLRQHLATYTTEHVVAIAIILTPEMLPMLEARDPSLLRPAVPIRLFAHIPEAVPWLRSIACVGCLVN